MKDFMTFWGPKYSVVSTSDTTTENCTKSAKSLDPKRSFFRGFSILDSFFHKRTPEKRTRCPKSMWFFYMLKELLLMMHMLIIPFNEFFF